MGFPFRFFQWFSFDCLVLFDTSNLSLWKTVIRVKIWKLEEDSTQHVLIIQNHIALQKIQANSRLYPQRFKPTHISFCFTSALNSHIISEAQQLTKLIINKPISERERLNHKNHKQKTKQKIHTHTHKNKNKTKTGTCCERLLFFVFV